MFKSSMLKMKMLLAALLAVTAFYSSTSRAALTCESVFSAQTRLTLKARRPTIAGTVASTVARLLSPKFKIQKFDTALANYREGGTADRPRTREERVAFIHYLSEANGHSSLYDLEDWVHRANPKQLKYLGKIIGRFNTDTGLSAAKLHNIFWSLKTFSSASPYGWLKRARIGNDGMDRIAIQQWSTKEITSNNAVKAAERLGFTPDPTRRRRFRDWLAAHPNLTENIVIGSMMVFETTSWPGSPLSTPVRSKLRTTRIDPFLLKVIETQGFDYAYPYLKAEYGNLAQFDRRFYFARQIFGAAMMGYMLSYMVPSVYNAVVPEPLRDSNLSPGQITTETVSHWILFFKMMHENMSPDEEAARVAAQPHVRAATAGGPRVAVVADEGRVSTGRVAVTFDEQTREPAKPKKTLPPPTAALGSEVDNEKAIDEFGGYLNSLDFTDPTNR